MNQKNQVILNINSTELLDKIMIGSEKAILEIQSGVLHNWVDKNIRPRIDEELAKQLISKIEVTTRKSVKTIIEEEFKYEELEPIIRELTLKIIHKMIDEELETIITKRIQEIKDKILKKALR